MKILHVADTHLHQGTQENVEWSMAQTLELARLEAPDLIIHCGDLSYSTGTIAPWISEALRRWFVDLARIAPVVVVAGNHDLSKDPTRAGVLRGILNLSAANDRISLFDRPGIMGFPIGERIERTLVGGRKEVWGERGVIPIAFLPYPNLAQLAATKPDLPPSEIRAHASELLEESVRALAVQMPGPGLLVFHGSIKNAITGTEQQMTTDTDVVLRESAIPAVFQAVLCGHIHKYQVLGNRAVYAGSPCPLDHGEEDHAHGVVLWENYPREDDDGWRHRFVELTPKHRLLTVDLREPSTPSKIGNITGAKVRVIAEVPRAVDVENVRREIVTRYTMNGAHSVTVTIEREAEDRACDSSSVRADASLASLLDAWVKRSPDAAPYLADLQELGAAIDGELPPEVLRMERLGDYRLLSFEARNWKCLSEVPRIDVSTLGKVVALVGDNGNGKSAVVEIEGFCLWDRVPKPLPRKGDYVRQGSDEMTMSVEFETGGQVYRVRRGIRLDKSGEGKGSLLLEKAATGGLDGWIPFSGTNANDTQKAIEALVGTWEMYCNTRNSPQGEAARLNEMPPGKLKDALQAALGVGVFEHRETCARERASAAEKRGDTLAAQVSVLDTRIQGLDAAREAVAAGEAAAAEAAQAVEQAKAAIGTAEAALEERRKELAEAEKLEERRKASRSRLEAIRARGVELVSDRRIAERAVAAGMAAQRALDSYEAQRAKLARLDALAKERAALVAAEKAAADRRSSDGDALIQGEMRLGRERDTAARAVKEAETRSLAHAKNSADERALADEAVEAERKVAEVAGTTPFGAQCVVRGCRLLALPIAAKGRLPVLAAGLVAMRERHESTADSLGRAYTEARDRLATLDAELLDLQAQNAPKVAALREALEQAERDYTNWMMKHGAWEEDWAGLMNDMRQLDEAEARAAVQAGTQALGRIAAIDAERARLFDEAGEVESELRDGQPDDALGIVEDALNAAKDALSLANGALAGAQQRQAFKHSVLARSRATLELIEADAARAAELRTQQAAELHTANVARIFARAMGRDGVPYLLLERAIGPLEAHANRFLAPTELRMEIEPMRDLASGAQKSEVRINYRNWTGLRPLAASSGHERAVLGAALRVALTSVQAEARGLKVSHVILDEIFNAAHNDRMPECQQMTRLFAETAGRAFVINHNPALNEIADDRIEVSGGVARLVGAPESSNGNGAGRLPSDASAGVDVRPAAPAPSTESPVNEVTP